MKVCEFVKQEIVEAIGTGVGLRRLFENLIVKKYGLSGIRSQSICLDWLEINYTDMSSNVVLSGEDMESEIETDLAEGWEDYLCHYTVTVVASGFTRSYGVRACVKSGTISFECGSEMKLGVDV